jgi:hypothetical protein
MEIDKSELRTEQLPDSFKSDYIAVLVDQVKKKRRLFIYFYKKATIKLKIDLFLSKIEHDETLTKEELFEKIELLLIQRELDSSDKKSKNFKFYHENRFVLGQFYFEAVNLSFITTLHLPTVKHLC